MKKFIYLAFFNLGISLMADAASPLYNLTNTTLYINNFGNFTKIPVGQSITLSNCSSNCNRTIGIQGYDGYLPLLNGVIDPSGNFRLSPSSPYSLGAANLYAFYDGNHTYLAQPGMLPYYQTAGGLPVPFKDWTNSAVLNSGTTGATATQLQSNLFYNLCQLPNSKYTKPSSIVQNFVYSLTCAQYTTSNSSDLKVSYIPSNSLYISRVNNYGNTYVNGANSAGCSAGSAISVDVNGNLACVPPGNYFGNFNVTYYNGQYIQLQKSDSSPKYYIKLRTPCTDSSVSSAPYISVSGTNNQITDATCINSIVQ
ncbi:MAG: hypothetical protein RLZZ293_2 [Pseudomonadota bacterium]|jgi:hypothetical protein